MKGTDDFAVVIGISHYHLIASLARASSDAANMAHWLSDPAGGGLPVENIAVLRATDEATEVSRSDVDREFDGVLEQVKRRERPGRGRMYIYMSGHGFGHGAGQVALLMSDASPEEGAQLSSIGATAYADFFYYSGEFDEVVLFVDCVRITQFHSEPASPPFALLRKSESRPASRSFYLFAAADPSEMGARAQPFTGDFTSALLEGLSGAATGPHGNITSESLHEYVAKSIESLDGRQRPESMSRGASIVFNPVAERGESTDAPYESAPKESAPTDENPETPAVTLKLSTGSRHALRWADAFREMLKQRHVHTEHLIAALYQSNDERVLDAFDKAEIDWPKLLSVLHQSESKIPITPNEIHVEPGKATAPPELSGGAKAGLGLGVDLARSEKSDAVLPHHLLFGVLSVDAPAAHTLRKRGLWREWLKQKTGPPSPRISPPAPLHVSRRTFALFQSDVPPPEIAGKEPAVPDALKLGDYARHLAEMMGARETPLPLSLGLFGDWGTGKTHFMRLLREKMRAQADRASSPWCQRVVPVQFNAWHYLDANLWASLVTEIFERLFKSIDRHQKTPKQKKDELLKKLEAENGAAAKAKDEVRQAKEAEQLAMDELLTAQKARDEKRLTLAGKLDEVGALIEIVGETPDGNELMRSWRELCRRLGWGELETSATGLRAQIAQTRSLGVRAQVLWETAFSPERRTRTLILLVATLVVVPLLGSAVGHALGSWHEGMEKVGRMAGAVSGWLTTVGAWLALWTQRAQKYLGDAEQLQRRLSTAMKKRAETPEIVKMRDALKAAEVVTNAAEKGFEDAQARVRALQEELREQEPERRLLRFIGDRAKADDYRKHLGLVSLVRRDFETLSNLFAEVQAEGRVKPKVEGTLEAEVDRIILYVDDLDRCPAKRVVEVLEAVHLLLAFPLFVVVVAVDPRWLQRSLRQHYPELLDERPGKRRLTAKGSSAATIRGPRSATPMDYLEKIFHVPFHLPRMEAKGYCDLVEELTQIKPPAEKATDAVTDSGPLKPTPSATEPLTPGTGSGLPEQKAEGKPMKARDPDTVPAPPEPEPRSVQLYPEEIAALQGYAAFIRTPRAVKRLLNTYRLVRAGLDEMPAEKLLPGANMAERCAPAMLLLAVAAGFPWQARDWFAAVSTGTWTEGMEPAELQGVPEFAELHNAVRVCGASRFASMPIDWKWWIERVGRFTF